MAPSPKTPLLANLRVQEQTEREVIKILRRAISGVDEEFRKLAGRDGVGAQVRRAQLQYSKVAMQRQLAQAWRDIGATVQAGKIEAAVAAAKVGIEYVAVLEASGLAPDVINGMRLSAIAQAESGVDAALVRTTLSRVDLSQQVYNTSVLANRWLDNYITSSVARGVSWRDLAKGVSGKINPNTPGGVSYAAKRLARTELNNAFHAQAVLQATKNPFIIGLEWHLSGSHPRPDRCNDYAGTVYEPRQCPAKPHPQCLCFVTPEIEDEATFIKKFVSGGYDEFLDTI